MAKKLRVFVYGTLKHGRTNHGAVEGNTSIGRATIRGKYRFVNLGWYPGVVASDTESEREIGGEVYEIDPDTLATLDMIEGHPSFYERRKVFTSLGCKAWCYFLSDEYLGRPEVTDLFWNQTDSETLWHEAREDAAA
jgi:gamma-glutamylcyclotransferase (GGCT)/AIG2-like uncharacterized protein YtfP